ncbi:MAG: hypothetical protein AMXMBFR33_09570 [Candidatus Xenobia bacterium]
MPSEQPAFLQLIRLDTAVYAGLLLLGATVLVRGLNRAASVAAHMVPARRLTILQLQTMLTFLVYIVAGSALVAALLWPSPQLLLAASGSAALAVGFALKDVASSLVAGLIIVLDRPFQVGDWVQFGDHYGEVVSIGIRTSRMVTLDDNLVTIPNSSFLTGAVASANAGNLDMMVSVPVHVALDADLEKAVSLVREVLVTSPYVYLNKPCTVGVAEVSEAEQFSLLLLARCYVLDVRFQKALTTDITVRTARAFRQAAIKRPGPG